MAIYYSDSEPRRCCSTCPPSSYWSSPVFRCEAAGKNGNGCDSYGRGRDLSHQHRRTSRKPCHLRVRPLFRTDLRLSYSTYTLIPGKIVRTYGAKYIVGRGMLISGIFFSIFVRPWTYSIDITPQVILGFCGLILIGTAAGSTFYHFGASLLPPVKAGTLANFDPVSSVILTALLLGTPFTTADLAGFLCIIGAVFLLQFYRSRKQRNKEKEAESGIFRLFCFLFIYFDVE